MPITVRPQPPTDMTLLTLPGTAALEVAEQMSALDALAQTLLAEQPALRTSVGRVEPLAVTWSETDYGHRFDVRVAVAVYSYQPLSESEGDRIRALGAVLCAHVAHATPLEEMAWLSLLSDGSSVDVAATQRILRSDCERPVADAVCLILETNA